MARRHGARDGMARRWVAVLLMAMIAWLVVVGPWMVLDAKLEGDGAWDPGSRHQRYRAAEFPEDRPFFQWWYFSLKDYDTGMTFAFDYSMSRPAIDPANRGCYVMAALVNATTRFHVYYKYPLEELAVGNSFDYLVGDQSLEEIDDGHYRARGNMDDPSRVWAAEGLSNTTTVAWDLDIHRVQGWYGQQDMEGLIKLAGVISWNTYAFDSEVNGSIWINGTRYDITRGPRFRMYCDMNWGETFPNGTPSIDHMWGWFYTGQPAADPSGDFSIIAGIGRSETRIGPANPFHGKFASMYLRGQCLGARQGRILDAPQDSGMLAFQGATDGACHAFRVDRSDWVNFTDAFGTASIPMMQVVTIETETRKVVMEFHSTPANYNRLLFPTDGYVFSDFEGLGVNCTTCIFGRGFDAGDVFRANPVYVLLETVEDHNAGIEYGYKVGTIFP